MTNQPEQPKQEAQAMYDWYIPYSVLVSMSWDQRLAEDDAEPEYCAMAKALNNSTDIKMGFGYRVKFTATLATAKYVLTYFKDYLEMWSSTEPGFARDPDNQADIDKVKPAISTLSKQIAKVEASHE